MLIEISNPYRVTKYDQVASLIRKEVIKYTPQLFYSEDYSSQSEPLSFASSILLKFKGNCFFVTAGHVFYDEDPQSIGVMISNEFCTIGGLLKGFEPNNNESYYPHYLDLAISKLDEATINMFKEQYEFLELPNYPSFHNSPALSAYLVFGYPAEITVSNISTKLITPASLTYRTIGADLSYYKDGIDINKTIILLAEQENIRSSSGGANKISEYGGISGCGVWKVTNLSLKNPQYELSGFVTGENESKSVFYSTRINVFFDLLKYFS